MRVFRTCRELGIRTVAVYSEADRGARHVREADEAVAIGPAEALRSYLSIETLLRAARETGAEAIHPGYGFLSQNGDFADAVRDAGLVFVGPPGDVHRLMGDKQAARRAMAAAGVPVLPGYDGDEQDDARLLAEAERIGWPVMLKPAHGGGGKGMRIVGRAADSPPRSRPRGARRAPPSGTRRCCSSATSSARATSRCRWWPTRTAPSLHLGERECSIQRRHQKVVEETPSPALSPRRAPRAVRGGRRRRARRRLPRRGNGRVPAGARRPLLLPRDEHAAPGRAPGDRGGDRPRPRAPAARGRGGPPLPLARSRSRAAATRSSVASTPRTRTTTTCRRRAASSTSPSPRDRASASTRGC